MVADTSQTRRPPDQLITLQQFVGAIYTGLGGVNDQAYAGQDGVVYNPTGQFTTPPSQAGTSVEGQPVAITPGGGIAISPAVVMLCIGVAAALIWKRG